MGINIPFSAGLIALAFSNAALGQDDALLNDIKPVSESTRNVLQSILTSTVSCDEIESCQTLTNNVDLAQFRRDETTISLLRRHYGRDIEAEIIHELGKRCGEAIVGRTSLAGSLQCGQNGFTYIYPF